MLLLFSTHLSCGYDSHEKVAVRLSPHQRRKGCTPSFARVGDTNAIGGVTLHRGTPILSGLIGTCDHILLISPNNNPSLCHSCRQHVPPCASPEGVVCLDDSPTGGNAPDARRCILIKAPIGMHPHRRFVNSTPVALVQLPVTMRQSAPVGHVKKTPTKSAFIA